jgi:hypothetical protein
MYHLKDSGELFAILPHGVLFRDNKEKDIRRKLIERKEMFAVIGLPGNLFKNTNIPTCIMVLKKNGADGSVFVIDAKDECRKEARYNYLTDEGISKISKAYQERNEIDKFSHLADSKELEENEGNLNIARYVLNYEEEYIPPMEQTVAKLTELQIKRKASQLYDEVLKLRPTEKWDDNIDGDVEELKYWLKILKEIIEYEPIDYSKVCATTHSYSYEEKRITDLGKMERAQTGKIYPKGTPYIRVSACSKNDEDKWFITDKPQELEGKYAVFLLDSDRDDDTKYLLEMFEMSVSDFLGKYVGDAINISMDLFKFYKIIYTSDKTVQEETVRMCRMIEEETKRTQEFKKLLEQSKKWFMDKMFVRDNERPCIPALRFPKAW